MKAFKTNVSTMSRGTLVPLMVSLFPSTLMAYGYALWFDIEHDKWGDFVADLLFPPLGILHGLSLLFAN
jgi:hypothetical protein